MTLSKQALDSIACPYATLPLSSWKYEKKKSLGQALREAKYSTENTQFEGDIFQRKLSEIVENNSTHKQSMKNNSFLDSVFQKPMKMLPGAEVSKDYWWSLSAIECPRLPKGFGDHEPLDSSNARGIPPASFGGIVIPLKGSQEFPSVSAPSAAPSVPTCRTYKCYQPARQAGDNYVVLEPSTFFNAPASYPTLRFPSTVTTKSKAIINEAVSKPQHISLPRVPTNVHSVSPSRTGTAPHQQPNSAEEPPPLELDPSEVMARESVKRHFVSSLLTGRCRIVRARHGVGVARGSDFQCNTLKTARQHWAPTHTRRLNSPLRSAPRSPWVSLSASYSTSPTILPKTFTSRKLESQ